MLDRVAAELGITRQALDDAFEAAYDWQANARFEEWVQGLVDDESLTSEEATEANAWFDDRPENSGPIALRLVRVSDSDTVADYLSKLVDAERLTQAESDALGTWHEDRPEALPASSDGKGHGHRKGHGRGGRH